jgi:hypothetical protein
MEGGSSRFLPPRPAGPEPELGARPAPPPAPEPQPAAPAWSQAPQQAEPDNGPAVAGFVLSVVSTGLIVLTFGLSSIVSLTCAIFGMVYSRRGKQKVERGETTKHAGLANAGWIVSIIGVVLSSLATVVYALVAVLLATDEEFREDFEREFDNSDTIRAVVRVAVALVT